MKKISCTKQLTAFSILTLIILSVACNGTGKEENASTTTDDVKDSSDYQLIWSDEFNGNAVDTTNWAYDLGGEGFGNHEKEYYQPANATVENGMLVITGKKEQVGKNLYTSTRMKTQGKHEFLYGKIEARIKIPVGQGLWPAFWMLGGNIDTIPWPASGETDIMEHINADSLLYGTLHWDSAGQHIQKGDTLTFTPSDFHAYSIEWDSSYIRWYIDGTKFHEVDIHDSINSTEEFHRPSFILLNLALAGDWPGQKVDESKLPAKMYVDYVRVYKQP